MRADAGIVAEDALYSCLSLLEFTARVAIIFDLVRQGRKIDV
jgi:hypothetical protein